MGTDLEADFFTVAYNNASAFLQVQYFPTEAIQLTAGGRFDHNTRFGSVFNPRAGLVVHPAEGTTVKLLYGSAYLAPSPYQAYVHFGSFFSEDDGETYKSFFWHLPNPDLKPQRAQSAELSLRQTIGSNVALTASGFYSKYTDLISLEGASDADYGNRYDGKYRGWDVGFIEVTVNEGEQHMYGGSVQLEYSDKFGRDTKIKSYASLSYADGDVYDKQLNKNIELGCISPIHMRFGADLSWRNLSFSPRLTYVGTQRTLAKAPDADGNATENRQTLEGYMLLNLSIRYDEIIDQLSAFLVIENALDSRYKNNHAAAFDPTAAGRFDGVPQHPLRATLGLSYKY